MTFRRFGDPALFPNVRKLFLFKCICLNQLIIVHKSTCISQWDAFLKIVANSASVEEKHKH